MKYLCELHRADTLIDSFGAESTNQAMAAASADPDNPDRLTIYPHADPTAPIATFDRLQTGWKRRK